MACYPDQQLVAAGEDLLVLRMGHTDYKITCGQPRGELISRWLRQVGPPVNVPANDSGTRCRAIIGWSRSFRSLIARVVLQSVAVDIVPANAPQPSLSISRHDSAFEKQARGGAIEVPGIVQ